MVVTQNYAQKSVSKDEVEALMIKHRKESSLPSLLYVARKLGEVEGMISIQKNPSKDLLNIQKDFKRVYDKLIDEAGIVLAPEREYRYW